MKIIGYNSSHETSLCQFDTDTWEIDFLYEEERFRRQKWFTPKDNDGQLLCVERQRVKTPDHFIGCSFDRRSWRIIWKEDELKYDKVLQRRILEFLRAEQLSTSRLKEVIEEFKDYIDQPDEFLKALEGEDGNNPHQPNTLPLDFLHTQTDDGLHGQVADQLDLEEFHYEIQHHSYHAECGYWFSPWKEKEKAIAVVMDGGGCQAYMSEYPNYQEVETIYLCQPDTVPTKQYQRLSNYRINNDMAGEFFNEMGYGKVHCTKDVHEERDGAEIVFSSYPSMGMNFSALSLFAGFDKLGRAAGKVMGAASYHEWIETEEGYTDWSTHSWANQLQQKSFEFTCKLIQRAIDLNPEVPNIILSGGFALNCTNNAKYLERFPNHQIFIDPVAHDGGTAVGGAIRLGRGIMQGDDI